MHNKRADRQWQIISDNIDFDDKSVLDLGCGYGDILVKCQKAGASVLGIEQDKEICHHLSSKGIAIVYSDIEKWIKQTSAGANVAICFSVLPYLSDPDSVLRWMAAHSGVALIECQYKGDGPGFSTIKDDRDMENWLLSIGWQSVEAIGKTLVDYRDVYRTIWYCR